MLKKKFMFILPVILLAGLLFSLARPVQALSNPGSVRGESLDPSSSLQAANLSAAALQDDPDALEKIDPQLLKDLDAGETADFFIWMVEKADLSPASRLSTKEEKGQFVFDALRSTAERTQADVRAALDAQGVGYKPFYISNKILVRGGNQSLLTSLASRPDVARLTANNRYQLEEPVVNPKGQETPQAVEPNISFVNADDVWALGFTGQGVVLAGNDTGLDWQHPAILNHYRGWNGVAADHNYSWWDATGTYPIAPGDGFGHGTHTTGTMVGDDGGTNQIGIAPGSKTIHCKNLDNFGGGWDETILECFQWDLAPWDLNGLNPRPDLAPDAVNNSWGYGGGGYPVMEDEIAALQAAGILIEASAGNAGPSCQTLGSPGDYGEVLTTGSVSHAGGTLPGSLTWFSSRGPSTLSLDYIPDVMAPGENVRSSLPGGGYANWDGTSMSGPHVTGLIGLMWAANPGLRGFVPETQQIIFTTSVPLTGQTGSSCGGDYNAGPNNDWGYGTIDALAAVEAAIVFGGTGTLEGTVTDAVTTSPLEGALIRASLDPDLTWQTMTNALGQYTRAVFSGTYTVTAQLYGYYPTEDTSISVISGTTTTLDIAMDPAPTYVVSGTVTDALTGWPLYARIDIDGYPFGPVWTDPVTGEYSINLAAGVDYIFNVSAWVDGYQSSLRNVGMLTGAQTEDFALFVDPIVCAAPGYQPEFVYFEDFEANEGGYVTTGNTSWEWGVPTSGPRSAHSGTNVWATNLTRDYFDYENGEIVSRAIDLSAYPGQTVIVTWWQWLQTEAFYDYARVDASNDGGATWTTIYGPVAGNIDSTWTKQTAILDPTYAVSDFKVRFHLDSDFVITFPGFYLDDVGIGVAPLAPVLYAEDFEANDGSLTAAGPNSSWAWGVPTRGPGSAHSGDNAWGTGLDANYNNLEDSTLTSPVIDLSGAAGEYLELSWWQWLQTESGYDDASVEVSNNGGGTWTTIYGPVNGVINTEWAQQAVVLDPGFAVSDFVVRFTLESDSDITYPGFYVDDLEITIFTGGPPALACDPGVGGLLVGNVYDFNSSMALNGASITSVDEIAFARPTPADPAVDDGFYTLFAPNGVQPITATLGGGYASVTLIPTVLLNDATRQDFYLPAGLLSADPVSLQATLDMGLSTTLALTLTNGGGLEVFYDVQERNLGFLPIRGISTLPQISKDLAQGSPFDTRTAPEGYQPLAVINPSVTDRAAGSDVACIFKDADPWGVAPVEAFLDANSIPYEVYSSSAFGTLDFDDCKMIVVSGDQPQGFYNEYAGYVSKFEDYVENGGFLNFFAAPLGWNGGYLSAPLPGGMVWNEGYDERNFIDDLSHPVVQGVPNPFQGYYASHGYFSELPAEGLIIAHSAGGNQPTIVNYGMGSGWLIAFTQPLEISHEWGWDAGLILENTLLWGYNFIPLDVPWLATDPVSGTLGAGGNQYFTITVDAAVPEIVQPGDFIAELKVKDDSPYQMANIPVVMTVNPPAGWGKLAGTITGLEVCDAPGAPLPGVDVQIDNVATTRSDANGLYGYWMPAGSYTVTIATGSYFPQTFMADISAGQTTTRNIDMRLAAPCMTQSPASFLVTVPEGSTTSQTLTLENTGAGDLNFNILESTLNFSSYVFSPAADRPASAFRLAPQSGPASALSVASQATRGQSEDSPQSGWFGGLDLPGGAIRYAFAQCYEQPESFYVFSGIDDRFGMSTGAWRYDAFTNTWTELADIPAGGEAPSAACYQGKIYVMGGSGTDQMYIYNIPGDSWTSGAPLPRGVEGAAAAAWAGQVYLVGGDDDFSPGTGVSGQVDIYDIATDSWVGIGAPMPIPSGSAGYTQVGPHLYVVGGWGETAPGANVSATQRYDMDADAWELGPGFESARADFALAATEQALYAIGGDEDRNFFFEATGRVERLDLSGWPAGAWEDTRDPLPVAFSANAAGFCTQALFAGDSAEVWSVGGLDTNFWAVSGRTLFQEMAGENCYSIYTDVSWLAEAPASGTIAGDTLGNVEVTFGDPSLPPGVYTATLAVISNDKQVSLRFIPVTLIMGDVRYLYFPLIPK